MMLIGIMVVLMVVIMITQLFDPPSGGRLA